MLCRTQVNLFVKNLNPLDKGQAGSTQTRHVGSVRALFPITGGGCVMRQAIKTRPETNHLQSQCKYWKGCGFAVLRALEVGTQHRLHFTGGEH